MSRVFRQIRDLHFPLHFRRRTTKPRLPGEATQGRPEPALSIISAGSKGSAKMPGRAVGSAKTWRGNRKAALFARFAGCQVGHLAPMIKPAVSDQFDYER
jgi:hypothetical protein